MAGQLLSCWSARVLYPAIPSNPAHLNSRSSRGLNTPPFTSRRRRGLAKKIRHKVGVIITLQSVLYLTPRDVPKIIAKT